MPLALIIGNPEAYHFREFLQGLTSDPAMKRRWDFRLHRPAQPAEGWQLDLPEGRPDVVISNWSPSAGQLARLRHAGIPCLLVSRDSALPLPRVVMDDRAVGSTVAEFFLRRRYRQCAYVEIDQVAIPRLPQRQEGFVARLADEAVPVESFTLRTPESSVAVVDLSQRRPELESWLKALPKPCGLMAYNDNVALAVITACRRAGVAVPEAVAVVGCGDDQTLCMLGEPTVSSLRLPFREIGQEVAKLLAGWTGPRSIAKVDLHLVAKDITTRGSSDLLEASDPLVARALQRLDKNLSRPLRMTRLAADLGVSVATLERRFRDSLRRSPLMELRRRRVEAAKRMLTETDLPLAQVAKRCGFGSAVRFSLAFKEITGQAPLRYRKSGAKSS